jgi:hypothetical protein
MFWRAGERKLRKPRWNTETDPRQTFRLAVMIALIAIVISLVIELFTRIFFWLYLVDATIFYLLSDSITDLIKGLRRGSDSLVSGSIFEFFFFSWLLLGCRQLFFLT